MSDPVPGALSMAIKYSRSRIFGWERGQPQPGGYTATLEGFGEAGHGTTIDGAVDDLSEKLEDWVADLDVDADFAPLARAGQLGQRTLLRAAQQLLIDGSLRRTLREAAARTEPVLDAMDEPVSNGPNRRTR